jgi:uncharacterized protein YndB with AHSA1/START domain
MNSITVTVVVRADPAEAFRMFTDEIDSWWKRGPLYRSKEGAMRFDSDRLLEGDAEIGRILAWEPGRRLQIEFRNWHFGTSEPSEVNVRFEPAGDGTRVTVEHHGRAARSTGGVEFRTVVGLWWGTLLTGLVARGVRGAAVAPAS